MSVFHVLDLRCLFGSQAEILCRSWICPDKSEAQWRCQAGYKFGVLGIRLLFKTM